MKVMPPTPEPVVSHAPKPIVSHAPKPIVSHARMPVVPHAPMKVVFHTGAGPDLLDRLGKVPGLDIVACPEDDTACLMRLLPECDVLWHVLKPCTAAMIADAPRLRLIQKIGVGVNTIDLDAARARGIPVCNLPGTNARAVAELTLTLMLAAIRRIARFDAGLRAGVWSNPALQDGIGELGGKTVGLVGYGAIPRLLAPILVAIGCDVIFAARRHVADATGRPVADATGRPVADATGRPAADAVGRPVADAVGRQVPLDALLAEADVVSLHVPLTPETERMIDTAALARMKPGAILVNTARGGLVDQVALTQALASGRLGAAGLDVFATEPTDPADPLFALPNVVVTPHIAWITTGTFERSFSIAAENCRRIAAGEPLLHRVA